MCVDPILDAISGGVIAGHLPVAGRAAGSGRHDPAVSPRVLPWHLAGSCAWCIGTMSAICCHGEARPSLVLQQTHSASGRHHPAAQRAAGGLPQGRRLSQQPRLAGAISKSAHRPLHTPWRGAAGSGRPDDKGYRAMPLELRSLLASVHVQPLLLSIPKLIFKHQMLHSTIYIAAGGAAGDVRAHGHAAAGFGDCGGGRRPQRRLHRRVHLGHTRRWVVFMIGFKVQVLPGCGQRACVLRRLEAATLRCVASGHSPIQSCSRILRSKA